MEAKAITKKKEANKPAEKKRLSKLGEWFYAPNSKPLIKIIDMRAVMR